MPPYDNVMFPGAAFLAPLIQRLTGLQSRLQGMNLPQNILGQINPLFSGLIQNLQGGQHPLAGVQMPQFNRPDVGNVAQAIQANPQFTRDRPMMPPTPMGGQHAIGRAGGVPDAIRARMQAGATPGIPGASAAGASGASFRTPSVTSAGGFGNVSQAANSTGRAYRSGGVTRNMNISRSSPGVSIARGLSRRRRRRRG